jgi:DNA primase
MRIPDEKVQEVREAVNIVDVVSQHVLLKQRGKSFIGLCPFHQEKTPSFTVDPVRGFYHCFGCGAGGDAFSFVMKLEKVGFLEAVKSLAERARIPLPVSEGDEAKSREIEDLYRANQLAMEFFTSMLWKSDEGKRARQYILGRGFERKTLDAFGIGYSPDRWDGLIKKAEAAGLATAVLHRAGLAVPRKDGGGFYDRFRGRLMFPVLNAAGRPVGFGGRLLGASETSPKYINTSESPVYQKGQILYGLFQSKSGIRHEDRALLVEGYTDMMRLAQAGFDNAVASSGTALTEGQVRLLSQYARNVTLVFDGDSAGLRAALRGIDVVLAGGLHADVAVLPKGMDPDAFLLRQGADSMRGILSQSLSFIDFQLRQMRERTGLSSSREKAEAARSLLATVSKIRDPMERQLTIKDVAEKLDIREDLLLRELPRESAGPAERTLPPAPEPVIPGKREKAESGLLAFLLSGGRPWAKLAFSAIPPDRFTGRETGALYRALYEENEAGRWPDAASLLDRFRADEKIPEVLSRLASDEGERASNRPQFGLDCVLRLIEQSHREAMTSLHKRMKTGDPAERDRLMQQWVQVKKTLENAKVEIDSEWKKIVEF